MDSLIANSHDLAEISTSISNITIFFILTKTLNDIYLMKNVELKNSNEKSWISLKPSKKAEIKITSEKSWTKLKNEKSRLKNFERKISYEKSQMPNLELFLELFQSILFNQHFLLYFTFIRLAGLVISAVWTFRT